MSEAPRSMEATTPPAVAEVAARRRAEPNGWWAMVMLVSTEAALLLALIASYFYLRFRSPAWPMDGIAPPSYTVPSILTGVLLLTSVPMFLAARAARRGRRRPAWMLLALAAFVQMGYLAMQLQLFTDDLAKFSPGDNAYGSIYFTLLGADHFHVGIGILLNLWLIARLLTGLTNYRVTGVRAVALYWYFVNALTACILLTQIYPSL